MDAKVKERARRIFEAHPEYKIIYMTEDGHFFSDRTQAMNYCLYENGKPRKPILNMLEIRRDDVFKPETDDAKTKPKTTPKNKTSKK